VTDGRQNAGDYRQSMALDWGWKAGAGAVIAFVLGMPLVFGALLAMSVAGVLTYLLIDWGYLGGDSRDTIRVPSDATLRAVPAMRWSTFFVPRMVYAAGIASNRT